MQAAMKGGRSRNYAAATPQSDPPKTQGFAISNTDGLVSSI